MRTRLPQGSPAMISKASRRTTQRPPERLPETTDHAAGFDYRELLNAKALFSRSGRPSKINGYLELSGADAMVYLWVPKRLQ
jgi:hypothetical protein